MTICTLTLAKLFGLHFYFILIDYLYLKENSIILCFRNKLLEKDGVLLIHDWERKHYKQLLQKGSQIDN